MWALKNKEASKLRNTEGIDLGIRDRFRNNEARALSAAQAEMPPALGPWNPVPVKRKVERRRHTNHAYITCLKMNFQYIKRYHNDSSDLVELLHRNNMCYIYIRYLQLL